MVRECREAVEVQSVSVRSARSVQVDVWCVRSAVRRGAARWCGSLEVCRALVALRDAAAGGRVAARELPALLRLVGLWRAAVARFARCGRGVSSYRLRALLWAAGVSASNKVLECLVLRFARRAKLSPEACLLALARLHLAHGTYTTTTITENLSFALQHDKPILS